MSGEMMCRVCGWWPPFVRVLKDQTTAQASDAWRWRKLYRHILEVADVEEENENPDGPHWKLVQELEGYAQGRRAGRPR